MRKFSATHLMAAACLAATARSLPAQLGKAVTTKGAGGISRTMSNGPTAWRDTTGWKLVLDHTVQPGSGTAGELIKPEAIALFPDGRLAVVDASPTVVRLYDASGKFLRNIGRDGSGPGEYEAPEIGSNGRVLVIQDPKLSRATFYTTDGTLLRSFTSVCCSFGLAPTVDMTSHISVASYSGGKNYWVVFDSTGRRVDSMATPKAMEGTQWKQVTATGSTTYAIPLAPRNEYLRTSDGGFIHGRTDRYEFIVSRTGRDTVSLFGRDGVTAVTVPTAYRDSVFHAKVDKNERLRSVAVKGDVGTVFDLWTQINRDGSGNLWVSRGGKFTGPMIFDVFAPTGAFLGAVSRPWPSAITSWAGDRVAVLDTDEDDLPRVRVYRIQR